MASGSRADMDNHVAFSSKTGHRHQSRPRLQQGLGSRHGPLQQRRSTLHHGLVWQVARATQINACHPPAVAWSRPQTSAGPLAVTWATDINTDPSCRSMSDPDVALGGILELGIMALGGSVSHLPQPGPHCCWVWAHLQLRLSSQRTRCSIFSFPSLHPICVVVSCHPLHEGRVAWVSTAP